MQQGVNRSQRFRRAHGEDLKAGPSRLSEAAASRQQKHEFKNRQTRGSEPKEDPRVSGSKVANIANAPGAGFNVYTEKSGGRAGGRGKRV